MKADSVLHSPMLVEGGDGNVYMGITAVRRFSMPFPEQRTYGILAFSSKATLLGTFYKPVTAQYYDWMLAPQWVGKDKVIFGMVEGVDSVHGMVTNLSHLTVVN